MPEITPDALARYMAIRKQQRAETVAKTLDAMTEREQALVREAAVMGYVHGLMSGKAGQTTVPPDSHVLTLVVTGCLSMPDLYPTVATLTEEPTDG